MDKDTAKDEKAVSSMDAGTQKAAVQPELKVAKGKVKVFRRGVTVFRTKEEADKMVNDTKKDKFPWELV